MSLVRAIILAAAVAAFAPCPAQAAAPPASPACGGVPSAEDPAPSLDDAFAQRLDDAGTLGLIDRVVQAPKEARAALLDSVKQPVAAGVRAQIDRAVRERCLAPLISQAAVRAANELAVSWSELPGERVDAFVARRLILALAAEAARDALSAPTVAAALDGVVPPESAAQPAPVTPCTEADSKPAVTHAAQPQYPANPMALRTGGTVQVMVQLDTHGFERAVRLYGAKFTGGDGDHAALVDASLISAALSTFRATTPGCPVTPGSYIFRVEFRTGG